MKPIDLKEHWQKILERDKPGFEHPDYTISDWKRAVMTGDTRQGYAAIVAALMTQGRPRIPAELHQFRPRIVFGKSVQNAIVTEFSETGVAMTAKADGFGWYAMRHAFENLIPFIVARGETDFIIAKATSENRKDLRELGAQKIYEWDGCAVPRYEDM